MLILWSASTTSLCGPQDVLSLEVLTPAEEQCDHRKRSFLADVLQPFLENTDWGRDFGGFFRHIYITEYLTEEEFSSSQASSSLVSQVNL